MKKQNQTKKRQTRSKKINRSKKHNKKSIKRGGVVESTFFVKNTCYHINFGNAQHNVEYRGQTDDKYLFFDQIYNTEVSLDKTKVNENNVRKIDC